VINISKLNFNDDLDRYIEKRRFTKPFYKDIIKTVKKTNYTEPDQEEGRKMIFGFLRRRIPSDDEIQYKVKKEQKMRQEAQMKETEMQDTQEEDSYANEEHTKKEGSVKKFVRKLFFTKVEDEYQEVQEDEPDQTEEIKNTLKILHRWLEKLPPEQITAFKNSEDFKKYKDALNKLGLTK